MSVVERFAALPLRTVLRRLLTPGIIVVTVLLLGAAIFSSSVALQVPKDNLSVIQALLPLADLRCSIGGSGRDLHGAGGSDSAVARSADRLARAFGIGGFRNPLALSGGNVGIRESAAAADKVRSGDEFIDALAVSTASAAYRSIRTVAWAGQWVSGSSGYLARGIDTLSPDERHQLQQLVQRALIQQRRIEKAISIRTHTAEVDDLLKQLQQRLPQAARLLQDIERIFLESPVISGDPQQFFQQATQVIDQLYRWAGNGGAFAQ